MGACRGDEFDPDPRSLAVIADLVDGAEGRVQTGPRRTGFCPFARVLAIRIRHVRDVLEHRIAVGRERCGEQGIA
ncbi:hypothetical protein D3I60_12150 [Brevibacterium permense]|nr:hypothetical protein [Brevibacterium permense]